MQAQLSIVKNRAVLEFSDEVLKHLGIGIHKAPVTQESGALCGTRPHRVCALANAFIKICCSDAMAPAGAPAGMPLTPEVSGTRSTGGQRFRLSAANSQLISLSSTALT
jgi:hypothetical protein